MSETDLVLAANRRFYQAFNNGDADRLVALLADRDDVACVHPGWPALLNRAEVVASWRSILRSRMTPQVSCTGEHVILNGETAVVLCQETINGVALAATNIYVRVGGDWRLLHHQATPVNPGMDNRPAERPPVLH
ncbi:nuclear transport factor 2 family protein [Aerophototrophica crusticola]|uniref:Nuclear transport factor 2 family protein n=1 Tax=Aerophototrophica crusticola TaxID=1709002 RepID=A0A858R768_9PROT|nr:nuclear transport factor 2 family protein [Rhodospirillaceae bacterium B3]